MYVGTRRDVFQNMCYFDLSLSLEFGGDADAYGKVMVAIVVMNIHIQ